MPPPKVRRASGSAWYAGPVGWVDGAGDGEFAVALRSAVVQGDHAWLFAGNGSNGETNRTCVNFVSNTVDITTGVGFVDYYLRIKQAEVARFQSEVTEWEQKEYFDLF